MEIEVIIQECDYSSEILSFLQFMPHKQIVKKLDLHYGYACWFAYKILNMPVVSVSLPNNNEKPINSENNCNIPLVSNMLHVDTIIKCPNCGDVFQINQCDIID